MNCRVHIAAVASGDIGISYCQEVSTAGRKHRHSVSVNTGWGLKFGRWYIIFSISFTTIKAGIDALVQKNGENTDRVRDLTRDLAKSEQKLARTELELADTRNELQDYKQELAQSQRENEQLKQQIYNLQHPQQSWDEPER